MKKKFLFIGLVMLLMTSVFAEELMFKSDANVRSQPSTDGTVITIITEGTHLEGKVSSENKNWYKVTVDGTTGYVHKSVVTSIITKSDITNAIVPFKSGLFWWIVIDKLILIGVFLFFFLTHKIGKSILWGLVCLGSTLLISFIFTILTEGPFVEIFGLTALVCVGVSPFILIILIVVLMLLWAMGTKKEPKLKAVTYWVEE